MKHKTHTHRIAIVALSAAMSLPFNPVIAQDMPLQDPPVVNVPPPTVTAPAPPPPVTTPAPPPVVAPAPPPPAATRPAPAEPPAARTARTTSSTVRRAPRTVQPRAEQASRPAAAAPAPAPAETTPTPAVEPVAPVAQAPLPPVEAPGPVEGQASTPSQWSLSTLWPWLLAGALLVIGAILLFGRRRRADEDVVYEDYQTEPTFAARRDEYRETPAAIADPELAYITPAAAVAAAPIAETHFDEADAEATPALDKVSVGEPASADVEALAAASEPEAGRPWIEFLMRPLRAGTTSDDAVVEFELTVGNTGSVPARDVRISTWMFAAGSAQESEMERMLIDPPAEARVSEVTIEPGDGTRVEGSLALPKSGLHEAILPVVVADARYRLPDGTEGRTSATFEVGMSVGDEEALEPFPVDRTSGLLETVEARLHGDLERV